MASYIPESKNLAGGECIVSVGLKKTWSRSVSYWVEIWRTDPSKKVEFLYALRRWKFVRRVEGTTEKVKGEEIGRRFTHMVQAHTAFVDHVERKLNEDYKVETALTRPDQTSYDLQCVEKQISDWRYGDKPSSTPVEVEEETPEEESKKKTFADSVKSRKKRAIW